MAEVDKVINHLEANPRIEVGEVEMEPGRSPITLLLPRSAWTRQAFCRTLREPLCMTGGHRMRLILAVMPSATSITCGN